MTLDCEIQRKIFTRIKLDFPDYTFEDYCREAAEPYRMLIARVLITADVDWEEQRKKVEAVTMRTKENVDSTQKCF